MLPEVVLTVRGAIPWLTAKVRDLVDGFLRACRVAGVQSPAGLPPTSRNEPEVARDELDGLYAQRNHVEGVIFDLQAWLPQAMVRGWLAGSAAQCMAPMLHYHPFHNLYNIITHVPAMLMVRAELYTSLGTCFDEGLLTEPTQVACALQSLADEFGSARDPFSAFLEQALLFTQFQDDLFRLNPNLQMHTATDSSVLVRVAVLHVAFYKRFKAAYEIGMMEKIQAPGGMVAAAHVLGQVGRDVAILLRSLESYAVRHGGPLRTAFNFVKKLHEETELEGETGWSNTVAEMKFSKDVGEPWSQAAREGQGVVDAGLANLLAAYMRRGSYV
jgi:hypothetical protein